MIKLLSRSIVLSIFASVLLGSYCFCADDETQLHDKQSSNAANGEHVLQPKSDKRVESSSTEESAPPNWPGDWNSVGARLYSGREKFINSGASCISCHTVQGRLFVPSLEKVARKKSGDKLASFLLKPGNLSMKMAYAKHPLTDRESAAICQYFASIGKEVNDSAAPTPNSGSRP